MVAPAVESTAARRLIPPRTGLFGQRRLLSHVRLPKTNVLRNGFQMTPNAPSERPGPDTTKEELDRRFRQHSLILPLSIRGADDSGMTTDVFLAQTLSDWQRAFDTLSARVGKILPRVELRQQLVLTPIFARSVGLGPTPRS